VVRRKKRAYQGRKRGGSEGGEKGNEEEEEMKKNKRKSVYTSILGQKSSDKRHSGLMTNKISSWTAPPTRTPPPMKAFAKSAWK